MRIKLDFKFEVETSDITHTAATSTEALMDKPTKKSYELSKRDLLVQKLELEAIQQLWKECISRLVIEDIDTPEVLKKLWLGISFIIDSSEWPRSFYENIETLYGLICFGISAFNEEQRNHIVAKFNRGADYFLDNEDNLREQLRPLQMEYAMGLRTVGALIQDKRMLTYSPEWLCLLGWKDTSD